MRNPFEGQVKSAYALQFAFLTLYSYVRLESNGLRCFTSYLELNWALSCPWLKVFHKLSRTQLGFVVSSPETP